MVENKCLNPPLPLSTCSRLHLKTSEVQVAHWAPDNHEMAYYVSLNHEQGYENLIWVTKIDKFLVLTLKTLKGIPLMNKYPANVMLIVGILLVLFLYLDFLLLLQRFSCPSVQVYLTVIDAPEREDLQNQYIVCKNPTHKFNLSTG